MEELLKFPEKYTVHPLYDTYPDEEIDVLAEQRLVEQYDKIIFQFPYYWFNYPALLKNGLMNCLLMDGHMAVKADIG